MLVIFLMEGSEFERITVLMMRGYGDRMRSYSEVADLFNEDFPNRTNPITRFTVARIVQRFNDTQSVKDRPKPGRAPSIDEEKSLDVMQSFVENPHLSTRRAALEHDISQSSVRRILKGNKFKPFKVKLVQELSEDDYDRRVEFCDVMMSKLDAEPELLNRILFSDEATFMTNGSVNRHNCRYWTDTNPHWYVEAHTQRPSKVNVWAGIVDNRLIGPFIIDGNLNSVKYLEMLQNQIVPALQNMFGQEAQNIWLQQDGAPPHYGREVRQYLNNVFPRRWIGRRGAVEWPARSPDLNPLDYFFWGYLKYLVYQTKPTDVDDLTERILHLSQTIPRESFLNAVSAFYTRLAHCQTAEGEQFEHLLH